MERVAVIRLNDPGKQGMGLIDRDEKIPMSILSRTRIGYGDSIALEQMSTWKTWKLQAACPGPVRLIIPLGGRTPRLVEHGERWLICLLGFRQRIDRVLRMVFDSSSSRSLVYCRSLDRMKKRKKIVWYRLYDVRGYFDDR